VELINAHASPDDTSWTKNSVINFEPQQNPARVNDKSKAPFSERTTPCLRHALDYPQLVTLEIGNIQINQKKKKKRKETRKLQKELEIQVSYSTR